MTMTRNEMTEAAEKLTKAAATIAYNTGNIAALRALRTNVGLHLRKFDTAVSLSRGAAGGNLSLSFYVSLSSGGESGVFPTEEFKRELEIAFAGAFDDILKRAEQNMSDVEKEAKNDLKTLAAKIGG